MPPKIHEDSLSTSYYGKGIYVEARQPEGGEAFVSLIEIEDLPSFNSPDLPNFPSLSDALNAGLRWATTMVDN